MGPSVNTKSGIRIANRTGANDANIEVVIDGEVLVRLDRYPIRDLACALEEWLGRVNDHDNVECFVFRVEDCPELTGTFRIEPRPIDWQFTSMYEEKRHHRLVSLLEYRQILQAFIDEERNP